MNSLKYKLGNLLLNMDDYFARHNIYFDLFIKDKDNHVNLLCKWGFNLVLNNYKEEK